MPARRRDAEGGPDEEKRSRITAQRERERKRERRKKKKETADGQVFRILLELKDLPDQ